MKKTDEFLDVKQVSKYIHVSKSFIYKKVCKNMIPHLKVGTRTLFVKSDVEQWVKSGMNPEFQMKSPILPKIPKL